MRRVASSIAIAACLCAPSVYAQQPAPAPAPPPGEPRLVFDRETYNYPRDNRRDPFRPLTGDEGGPLFQDLRLRMIIFSQNPAQSIVVVSDAANKTHRLRRGDSVGNVTVLDIARTRVVFGVEDFGVQRQEIIELKPRNPEGASR